MKNVLSAVLTVFAVCATAAPAEETPPEVSRCKVRVLQVCYLREFAGIVVAAHFDSKFVATVELLEDCKTLDRKSGDKVNLAIHSVGETFSSERIETVSGKAYTIEILRLMVKGKPHLLVSHSTTDMDENTPSKKDIPKPPNQETK